MYIPSDSFVFRSSIYCLLDYSYNSYNSHKNGIFRQNILMCTYSAIHELNMAYNIFISCYIITTIPTIYILDKTIWYLKCFFLFSNMYLHIIQTPTEKNVSLMLFLEIYKKLLC